ncbi:TetR family transcriptional regulator [Azorhizobium oxalatiphilum]|uniref:TetR family transcriptional regulator n=2 Tax=Azorhizobium oxalatiphilum TaxID=980631 RepID=A0A917FMC9_9HYPH|nr:TetR family transcriptional regulator [Azorhizobium oxalatiphilum]
MTRARLRRAATNVFARNGYHATKVSDIVAAAGVTQPTFYIYCESKEAAYEALVAAFRDNLRQITLTNLIDPAIPQAELETRVAQSFHRFLDFMAQDRALTEIGFFQPPGCSQTKALMVDWVAANIAQEQAGGVFRADIPAAHIARMLVGLLDQMGRMNTDAAGRGELARHCARLFCGGVGMRTG